MGKLRKVSGLTVAKATRASKKKAVYFISSCFENIKIMLKLIICVFLE